MSQRAAQIACPNCRSPLQVALTQLVDADIDPGADPRLLSGSLNFVRCPVCGYQGQLATPLVYHDADKELLLTYMPVELSLPKDEQERVLGRLINQAIDRLPARAQGLPAAAAGRTDPAGVGGAGAAGRRDHPGGTGGPAGQTAAVRGAAADSAGRCAAFTAQHDQQLDAEFFQLASLSLGPHRTGAPARPATPARSGPAVDLLWEAAAGACEASCGRAAESRRQLGEGLTREKLLDLFVQAPAPGEFRPWAAWPARVWTMVSSRPCRSRIPPPRGRRASD